VACSTTMLGLGATVVKHSPNAGSPRNPRLSLDSGPSLIATLSWVRLTRGSIPGTGASWSTIPRPLLSMTVPAKCRQSARKPSISTARSTLWLIRVAMTATGVVNGCRLCLLSPKVHDGARTLRCRICSVTYRNNKVRRLLQRATQMPQLGGVSILSPLSGSLN